MKGTVALNSWAGRHEHAVTIVGETPKFYRVIFEQDTKLPKRFVKAGEEVLVPKASVKLAQATQK